jgi:hypothetical protein
MATSERNSKLDTEIVCAIHDYLTGRGIEPTSLSSHLTREFIRLYTRGKIVLTLKKLAVSFAFAAVICVFWLQEFERFGFWFKTCTTLGVLVAWEDILDLTTSLAGKKMILTLDELFMTNKGEWSPKEE